MAHPITLSVLALRPLAHAAASAAGMAAAHGTVDAIAGFLVNRFKDNSQNLTEALRKAHDRAWRAVELSLAGTSWWETAKSALTPGEDKAFAGQIRAFLQQNDLAEYFRDDLRRSAKDEFDQARKAGLLDYRDAATDDLADAAAPFARYTDPLAQLSAERDGVGQIAGRLVDAGYPNLAKWVLPPQGVPLVAIAARYFFRRAVEDDPKLFHAVAFAQLERLQESQEKAFGGLHDALDQHADRIGQLLGDIQTVVVETRDTVLDIRLEQERQGQQHAGLYRAVVEIQRKLDLMHHGVKARDSMSIRGDTERRLVEQVVNRYRSLPESQRDKLPALLNAVGQLEVAAGNFEAAQADFAEVAQLVDDRPAKAQAHLNAYRAALERRDFAGALKEMTTAIELGGTAVEPFPIEKYQPKRILGAGGFGVAFLCMHKFMNAPVVVKTLADDELEQSIDRIFAEAQALRQLDHPAIIRVQDCAYAGANGQRPYLVMDYFDGPTLDEYVKANGPLSPDDFLALARPVAQGLRVAHAKGILHRDIKPANLLVRKDKGTWRVKIIDFGLALRPRTLRDTSRASKTVTGASIAGTVEYAAPEQMGRLDAPMSAASDVYGFGKTGCFALFQTTNPIQKHWKAIPESLSEFLGRCLEEDPKERIRDGQILERCLAKLGTGRASDRIDEVLPVQPVAPPPPVGRLEPPPSKRREPVAPRRVVDEPPPKPKRKRGYLGIAIALGVVGLVVAGVVFASRGVSGLRLGTVGVHRYGRDQSVEVKVNNVADEETLQAFMAKLKTMTDDPANAQVSVFPLGNPRSVTVAPATNVKKLMDRINAEYGNVASEPDDFFRWMNVDGSQLPLTPPEVPVTLEQARAPFLGSGTGSGPPAKVYLADMKMYGIRNGYYPIGIGKLTDRDPRNPKIGTLPIRHDSKLYPKGIGMHPGDNGQVACAWFRLGGQARRFWVMAAMNDSAGRGNDKGVVFEIHCDGKLKWRSTDPLKLADEARIVNLDVTGVDLLRLSTRALGPKDNAHAVWLDPWVSATPGRPDEMKCD